MQPLKNEPEGNFTQDYSEVFGGPLAENVPMVEKFHQPAACKCIKENRKSASPGGAWPPERLLRYQRLRPSA